MKKFLLATVLLSALAITSCKKAKDAADATADAAGSAVETVGDTAGDVVDGTVDAANDVVDATTNYFGEDFSVPEFSDPKATEWANSLVSATNELKEASVKGDLDAVNTLSEKFNSVVAQAKDFAGSEDFAKVTELAGKATKIISGS